MPRRGSPYGPVYERRRAVLLAGWFPCRLRLGGCTGRATSLDHQPALGLHRHLEGSGCCVLVDCCLACNLRAGRWRVVNERRGKRVKSLAAMRVPAPSREW
jgi:hypothetical protein